MHDVVIVLLLVVLALAACLVWICIKLIGNRLDADSLSKLAQVYVNDMANGYVKGYNQKLTADAIPPTGPQPDPGWRKLEESEPYIPQDEDESEEI